jgi:ubiquitin carboxyl-terminal hydrolase 9/13
MTHPQYVKLTYRVVFPFSLRLFNTSDDAPDPDRLYDLFAIVVHVGTGPHHGHYVAIIKVGRRWCVFDDETITFIEEADIVRYYGDTPGTGSAYVLFYQARDLDFEGLGLPPHAPLAWAPPPPPRAFMAQGMSGAAAGTASAGSYATPLAGGSHAGSGAATPAGSAAATPAGFFARRQASGAETDLPSGAQTPASQSGAGGANGGGWLSSLRSGGRERRATNSSMGASAPNTPADALSNSMTLPPPPSSFRPPVVSTNAGLGFEQQDDAASMRTSSTGSAAAALVARGRSDGTVGLGLPNAAGISRTSSASPGPRSTQLPATLVEEPVTFGDYTPAVPAAASLQAPSAPDQTLVSPMSEVPGVSLDSVARGAAPTTPSKPAAAPTASTPSPSPMKASASGGAVPASPLVSQGAAFAPADRPLSKKEQQRIAKESRRSSVHSTHGTALPMGMTAAPSAPALPSSFTPAQTEGHVKRRSTLGRFGFGKKDKDK